MISSAAFAATPRDGVNAVLGDESWIARFGVVPGDDVDEDMRLRVHLEHVEALLRASTPVGLNEAQRAERGRNLDRLHAYIERGEFPRNHGYVGRRPHFIDEEGRICAVGYLVEQSAGRDVAERINRAHEWDYIFDIRGIDAWVEASGLTLTELAMIQPGYGFKPHPMPVPVPRPPDEGTTQRRLVMNAFDTATRAVQGCADRFGWWRHSVSVTVTVFRFGTRVNVDRGSGGLGLRRCVQRAVERHLGGIGFSRRTAAMSVHRSFVLDASLDEDDNDDRWAQPPPY